MSASRDDIHETSWEARLASASRGNGVAPTRAKPLAVSSGARRRGRPMEMAPEDVLTRIRVLATRDEGLIRVHITHPALYARARRLFGSWEGAVLASGLNYTEIVAIAMRRSTLTRKRRARRTVVTAP
jgi:hypothetical protein